jgi:hypothetical protein
MSLRQDIAESFQKKGLEFISLNESTLNPERTTLVYVDKTGNKVSKEIEIRLSELEDTVEALDVIDPEDIAEFLLKENPPR